jgi:hypothetical protein
MQLIALDCNVTTFSIAFFACLLLPSTVTNVMTTTDCSFRRAAS